MSEPRYPTRVSDPDETTRIPKDALAELRDADQARDSAWSNGSSGGGPAPTPAREASKPANGSPTPGAGRPAGANGLPSDGAPAAPRGAARPPLFGGGTGGADGLGSPAAGPNGSGGFRSEPATAGPGPAAGLGPSAGSPPAVPPPIGYPERSQTGYSPAAYQSSYSPTYPSVGAPTTVTGAGGPGPAPTTAAGAGLGRAAARSSLSTAGRPSPAGRGATNAARPPRRARLLVRHIDPWSTLKFSFVLSVAMFFVWLVAVGVLYGVLDGMGVFEQINGLYDEVSGNSGDRLFSPGLVLGSATVVGAVNIVLFTALATIGAFVYNICSDLVGGIEVTLAERD